MGDVFNPPLKVYRNFAWQELKWFLSWPFKTKHERVNQPKPPVLEDNHRFKAWKDEQQGEV